MSERRWYEFHRDRYGMDWPASSAAKRKKDRVYYASRECFKMFSPAWNVSQDILWHTLGDAEDNHVLNYYDTFYLQRFPWRNVTALHMNTITRRLAGKDTIYGE